MAMSKQEYKVKADKHMEKGKKLAKGGFFSGADWEAASREYAEAVKFYRMAGHNDALMLNALLVSAEAFEKSKNPSYHFAAKNMEAAATLADTLPGEEKKRAEYWTRAADLHRLNNYPDRAVQDLVKAAMIVGATNIDEAMALFNRAADTVEEEDRHNFTNEAYKQFLAFLLKNNYVEQAIHVLQRQNAAYQKNLQLFDKYLYKNILSIVVLRLHRSEYKEAAQDLSQSIMIGDFIGTKECELANMLLAAVKKGDEKEFTDVANNSQFTYLDNEVAKIAKRLKLDPEQAAAAADSIAVTDPELVQANESVDLT